MDTIRLADINQNKYLITGEMLKYQPTPATKHSAGHPSQKISKERAVTADQWQEIQELTQAILDNSVNLSPSDQGRSAVLKVSEGLHKQKHSITHSAELDALRSYLDTLLDG